MFSTVSSFALRSGSPSLLLASSRTAAALRSSSTTAATTRLLLLGNNNSNNDSVSSSSSSYASLVIHSNQQRFFASSSSSDSGSHDDFAPQKKKIGDDGGEDEAIKLIKEHVENNKIMLYMKGNPSMPMCGFSARVVDVLQKEGVDFSSVNVLDYPTIREGVKKYADWPTIPQLYVNGEFIGGCDIITSMHESGELKEVLEEEKK